MDATGAIIAAIVSAIAGVGNFILQGVQTVRSVPWKTIFVWSIVVGFIGYFTAVTWNLFQVSMSALRIVFSASNSLTGTPADYSSSTFAFSSIWSTLQSIVPDFHRFFFWFLGFDWLIWLGVNALHFGIVSYLLTKFARPISHVVHFVAESL